MRCPLLAVFIQTDLYAADTSALGAPGAHAKPPFARAHACIAIPYNTPQQWRLEVPAPACPSGEFISARECTERIESAPTRPLIELESRRADGVPRGARARRVRPIVMQRGPSAPGERAGSCAIPPSPGRRLPPCLKHDRHRSTQAPPAHLPTYSETNPAPLNPPRLRTPHGAPAHGAPRASGTG